MNAFADWLDNDTNFYLFMGCVSLIVPLTFWVIKGICSLSSRGEEAGTEETGCTWPDCDCPGADEVEHDDEMAVAEATTKDDFQVWEAECAKLQRLADKLGTRSTS